MDQDIVDLKAEYTEAYPFRGTSYRQWAIAKGSKLGVSLTTIYYHTNPSYQAKMKANNAKAHSKADMEDYVAHRAYEARLRVERLDRNPALREWTYRLAAKYRLNRKTCLGKPID